MARTTPQGGDHPAPLNIFSVAPEGANSRASMISAVPLGSRILMKPPPPMPDAMGLNTPSHNAVVTQASAALPPLRRMLRPSEAAGNVAVRSLQFAVCSPHHYAADQMWLTITHSGTETLTHLAAPTVVCGHGAMPPCCQPRPVLPVKLRHTCSRHPNTETVKTRCQDAKVQVHKLNTDGCQRHHVINQLLHLPQGCASQDGCLHGCCCYCCCPAQAVMTPPTLRLCR